MSPRLLRKERFASIQEAQAGLSRLLAQAELQGSFVRLMRHNKPLGVILPNKTWESLLEDIAAYSSPTYLRSIAASRQGKKRYTAAQVKRLLAL